MLRATSLHSSIAFTILIGQFLGLIPLCGIFHHDESRLRIKWKSMRFICTIIVLIGSILYVQFIIVWMITAGITLNNLLSLVAYTGCLLNVILFYKLGMKWSELLKLWRCMELIFPTNTAFTRDTLKLKMNLITMVVIGISIGNILI